MSLESPAVVSDESVGTLIVAELNHRVADAVEEFQASALGQLLADPDSSVGLLTATIQEIYWEIHCY